MNIKITMISCIWWEINFFIFENIQQEKLSDLSHMIFVRQNYKIFWQAYKDFIYKGKMEIWMVRIKYI